MSTFRRMSVVAFVLAFGLFSAMVYAQDKKVDVTGKWKYTQQGRGGGGGGGQPQEVVLTLKQEGDKVTGSLPAGRQGGEPTQITDGKIAGDMLTFTVSRTFNDQTRVTKYSGKVEADKITGKIERPGRGGDAAPVTTDWVATRVKE